MKMSVGVVTAMAGFFMYSHCKLAAAAAKRAEEARAASPPRGQDAGEMGLPLRCNVQTMHETMPVYAAVLDDIPQSAVLPCQYRYQWEFESQTSMSGATSAHVLAC